MKVSFESELYKRIEERNKLIAELNKEKIELVAELLSRGVIIPLKFWNS